ncbi:glycosyltransferase [Acinetobacter indicus]|uniref:glycosyltransferase n=1 Tax=Acinetobacter indicus TaxID=756892 RepID=UPI003988ADD8
MSSLKCLYVHDHTFKKMGNDYYSEGKITDAVFSRYINATDRLNVYSRMEETKLPNSLTKITAKNVNFCPVEGQSFSLVFTKNISKNIKLALSEIREADFIVVRLPSFLGIFILFLNLFFKKKYFVELVGDAKEALLTSKVEISFSFKIFVSFFAFLNAFFVKRADGVIYVTESALQNKYPTTALQSYASNVELRIEDKLLNLQTYQNEKSYFKIGMIGSFNNSYKGIDDAIRAVYMLSKKENIVHLHILGSGKLKSEYLAMAKEMGLVDNIIFDDVLSGGAEVNQWLDSLDLYGFVAQRFHNYMILKVLIIF